MEIIPTSFNITDDQMLMVHAYNPTWKAEIDRITVQGQPEQSAYHTKK
jgi:hypothetical protein